MYNNFGDYNVNLALGGNTSDTQCLVSHNNDSFILDGQANRKYCQGNFDSTNVLSAVKQLIKKTKVKKGGRIGQTGLKQGWGHLGWFEEIMELFKNFCKSKSEFPVLCGLREPGLGPVTVPGVRFLLVAAAS